MIPKGTAKIPSGIEWNRPSVLESEVITATPLRTGRDPDS